MHALFNAKINIDYILKSLDFLVLSTLLVFRFCFKSVFQSKFVRPPPSLSRDLSHDHAKWRGSAMFFWRKIFHYFHSKIRIMQWNLLKGGSHIKIQGTVMKKNITFFLETLRGVVVGNQKHTMYHLVF